MSRQKRFHVLMATIALVLIGCGGGGGEKPITSMTDALRPELVTVELRKETGSPTREEVSAYLRNAAGGGPWYSGNQREFSWSHPPGLVRYSRVPTVRMAEGTNDHQRATILHAVAMVNRALPYDNHIQIGPDAVPGTWVRDVPDGEIFVSFAPHDDWLPPPQPDFKPTGQAAHRWTETNGRKREHLAAHVWIDARLDPGDRVTMSTLVHELLHALGISGHVAPSDFPGSFVRETLPPFETHLGAIDIAALQVLYTRLDVATQLEELSPESLGEWDDEAANLVGRLEAGGTITFGVRHHNGVSVPWTDGTDPATALADNRSLRGAVTWEGKLLGFTPEEESVAGDAAIRVDLGTLTGRADFTELTSGADGEQWLDGDLGYVIAVGGNYIRSTGGDAGTLAGRFYGRSHEGVAGSVERQDLTAAFGGSRR